MSGPVLAEFAAGYHTSRSSSRRADGAGQTIARSLLLPPEVVFLNADVEAGG